MDVQPGGTPRSRILAVLLLPLLIAACCMPAAGPTATFASAPAVLRGTWVGALRTDAGPVPFRLERLKATLVGPREYVVEGTLRLDGEDPLPLSGSGWFDGPEGDAPRAGRAPARALATRSGFEVAAHRGDGTIRLHLVGTSHDPDGPYRGRADDPRTGRRHDVTLEREADAGTGPAGP